MNETPDFVNRTEYMKWAEIDLDALMWNISEIRRLVGDETKLCAVVKANGYGHGALEIVEPLLLSGVDMIAVSSVNEAVEIRKKYKKAQTMVLGVTPDENAAEAIRHGVIQTLVSEKQARLLSELAEDLKMGVSCHIKLDTGMNRIGFRVSEESADIIAGIAQLPNIHVNGMFSHFATADERDKTFTRQQLSRYLWMVEALQKRGVKIPIRHIANSAGIIDVPEAKLDMVRAGIMMYGIYPSREVHRERVHLKPVMSLKTKITHIKTMEADEGISYGLRDVVKKGAVIATIPVGYADGYMRGIGQKAEVLVKALKSPVRGKICMDQCMIDVTHIKGAKIGDEVVLFGSQDDAVISIEDLAEAAGTISYELLCMIGRRVPRVYIRGGQVVNVTDYLL